VRAPQEEHGEREVGNLNQSSSARRFVAMRAGRAAADHKLGDKQAAQGAASTRSAIGRRDRHAEQALRGCQEHFADLALVERQRGELASADRVGQAGCPRAGVHWLTFAERSRRVRRQLCRMARSAATRTRVSKPAAPATNEQELVDAQTLAGMDQDLGECLAEMLTVSGEGEQSDHQRDAASSAAADRAARTVGPVGFRRAARMAYAAKSVSTTLSTGLLARAAG
jgi:hypothetical protein